MIILVMGVMGAGKTTVGRLLAAALAARFVEGDDYHPPANVAKMRAGLPLDDADRSGWLEALHHAVAAAGQDREDVVLACSALKPAYRDILFRGARSWRVVWLRGDRRTVADRVAARQGHFMPPALLDSQFAILSPPADAIVADIAGPPQAIVDFILPRLSA
jgi:gluconokinase